jgi:hypothetical protein
MHNAPRTRNKTLQKRLWPPTLNINTKMHSTS